MNAHNATHPHSHFVFPDCEVFPALCSRSGILSVHEDEPLAPPAGGAFFMRCLLCATGAASAALSGGFAGQRLKPVLSQVAGNGCQVGKPATPFSVVTAGHLEGRDVVEEIGCCDRRAG